MDNIKNIFGWSALILTIFIYVSPAIPFIKVLRGKISYEETPGFLVLATYISCFLWYIYGEIIMSNQVMIGNCIGAICSLCFITIYLVYEIKKYPTDAVLNTLIIITGSTATYRFITTSIDDFLIIGIICNISSIIVFVNHIYLIYKMLREKNKYVFLQFYKAWISLFAYSTWIIYLILIKDTYLLISNIIGIVSAIIQIRIYIKFMRKYPKFIEKNKYISTVDIEISGNDDIREDKPIKEDEDKLKEVPVKINSKIDN